jgi:hypothetical protein
VTTFRTELEAQLERANAASERFGRVREQNTNEVVAAADRLLAAFNEVTDTIERRRMACAVERVRAQARLRAQNNGITCEVELAGIEDVAEAHLRMGNSHETSVVAAAGEYRKAAA